MSFKTQQYGLSSLQLEHHIYIFNFAGDYPQRRFPHKLMGSGCKPEPAVATFFLPSRKRGWVCVVENLHTPLSPLFRGESKKFKIPASNFEFIQNYHFMIFISSMFTVSLFLNTATIIARPTAASAAATVMVKNTNN